MKTLFKSLLLVFLSSTAFGQELFEAKNLSSEWSVLEENDQLKFEISRSACQIQGVKEAFDYAFIKITNKTSTEKNVSFQIGSWFGGECVDCDMNNETIRNISIAPNSSVTGDCSFAHGQLSILIRNPLIPVSDVKLDGYQLLNLKSN